MSRRWMAAEGRYGSASHVVFEGRVDEARRLAEAACGALLAAPRATASQADEGGLSLRRCRKCLALVAPQLGEPVGS